MLPPYEPYEFLPVYFLPSVILYFSDIVIMAKLSTAQGGVTMTDVVPEAAGLEEQTTQKRTTRSSAGDKISRPPRYDTTEDEAPKKKRKTKDTTAISPPSIQVPSSGTKGRGKKPPKTKKTEVNKGNK